LLNDSSITAGEPTPEAHRIRILTVIPDFDTFKTSVNPGSNPGSTSKSVLPVDGSFCIFAKPIGDGLGVLLGGFHGALP
jgi:hypothetical protein